MIQVVDCDASWPRRFEGLKEEDQPPTPWWARLHDCYSREVEADGTAGSIEEYGPGKNAGNRQILAAAGPTDDERRSSRSDA